ncbi:hypothetical protein, partial [Faecalitalea cylindroides]
FAQGGYMKSNSTMKVSGILMILFGIVYAILAIMTYTGSVQGLLPGHESQEVMVAVLSAAVALLALIGGICAVMGNKPVAKVIGFVFAAVGLVSLIYLQFTQNAFNIADCIAMVLGVMLFTSAKE